ncbi:MAG: threonine/serine ThrE exporter family protein, partial [Streptosporangiales bacterium]
MSNDRTPRRLGGVMQRTRGALRVLRGDAPAYLVATRHRDSQVDDLIAHDVLDLTLRTGEALLSTGSPVAGVTATMLRVAAAYGLTSIQVDVTFTSITVSVMRDDGEPMTSMRIVRVRAADYSRLAALYELADQIVAGLPLEEALQRLDAIVHAPHPYRRWLVTLALAGMAAGISGLLGAGLPIAAVTALTTAGIDRMLRRLNRWGLPSFFQQAAAAAFVTLIAVGILLAKPLPFDMHLDASLLVGSGITVLLAGLGVVGSVEDAISGHYLTAGARTFEVVLNTVGIVVGVGAVLDIANRLGLDLTKVEDLDLGSVRPTALIPIAAVVAGFWALSSYARWRASLVAAAGGGIAYVIYAALLRDAGVGPAVASAGAALVLGAIADIAGDRTKVPTLVVAMSGVVPFLPGLTTYRGISDFVQGATLTGISELVSAASIGLGLAAGVALGAFVARPLRSEVDRWER